jgi:hypothetical protein
VDLDRSGRVKADTLWYFYSTPGQHASRDLLLSPALGALYSQFLENRSIQMRLLRYCKLGILSRERVGRGYLYSITETGKKRLVYLWEKLGDLDQTKAVTEPERKAIEARRKIAASILSEVNFEVQKRRIRES